MICHLCKQSAVFSVFNILSKSNELLYSMHFYFIFMKLFNICVDAHIYSTLANLTTPAWWRMAGLVIILYMTWKGLTFCWEQMITFALWKWVFMFFSQLHKPAHRLFSIENSIVILYTDGSIGLTSTVLYEAPDHDEQYQIFWCDSYAVLEKKYIVAIFCNQVGVLFFYFIVFFPCNYPLAQHELVGEGVL